MKWAGHPRYTTVPWYRYLTINHGIYQADYRSLPFRSVPGTRQYEDQKLEAVAFMRPVVQRVSALTRTVRKWCSETAINKYDTLQTMTPRGSLVALSTD